MNRVINIFTFLVALLYFLVLQALAFDLSISNIHLNGLPFKQETFIGLSIIVLLLGAIRIQRRRQGIKDMKKFQGFVFTSPIPKSHLKSCALKTWIETFMYAGLLMLSIPGYLVEPNYALPMMVVAFLLLLNSLAFGFRLLKGSSVFQIGISPELVAYFDREMHLFYFTGLKRVELYQQDLINLTYKEDLNLAIETDVISKENRATFKENFTQVLAEKQVYFDDSFRNWQ